MPREREMAPAQHKPDHILVGQEEAAGFVLHCDRCKAREPLGGRIAADVMLREMKRFRRKHGKCVTKEAPDAA